MLLKKWLSKREQKKLIRTKKLRLLKPTRGSQVKSDGRVRKVESQKRRSLYMRCSRASKIVIKSNLGDNNSQKKFKNSSLIPKSKRNRKEVRL